MNIKDHNKIFSALADETRLRIVNILSNCELNVQDLVSVLSQSQPRVSRHLKILDEANLIERIKEGNWVFCKLISSEGIRPIIDYVSKTKKNNSDIYTRDQKKLSLLIKNRAREANYYFNRIESEDASIGEYNISDNIIDQKIISIIEKNIKLPLSDIIDLGTGSGKILSLLSGSYLHGIGIDNNPNMLKMARSRFKQQGIQNCDLTFGDITDLSLKENNADLVVLHQVMHYFDDPNILISQAARLLMRDKYILVVDFDSHSNESLRKRFSHRRLGFSDEQIINIFEKYNCILIDKDSGASNRLKNVEGLVCKIWLGKKQGK
tara:strand:- start:22065 stop:23030 length:966 start_codon:yes stop_codon:yes gene_type:complete